jgi:hypothetical protein
VKVHYYLPINSSLEEAKVSSLASIRLRAIPAITGLMNMGHMVTFGSFCPNNENLDLAIFGKLGSPAEVPRREILWGNEIEYLKKKGIKIGIDYSDHHLGVASNQTKFYKNSISYADYVTVPSNKMAALVAPYYQGPIHHIPDAVEFDMLPPRRGSHNPRSIFWFGAKSNLKYLFDFIQSLKYDEPLVLNVLTDIKGINIFQSTRFVSESKFTVNLDIWTLNKMTETALRSDVCIIPSDTSDIRKNGVGVNRLMTAFALGLPVAATLVDSYSEFSGYFVDINKPDLFLLMKKPEMFHKDVVLAQKNIVNNFTKKSISENWCNFIERLF